MCGTFFIFCLCSFFNPGVLVSALGKKALVLPFLVGQVCLWYLRAADTQVPLQTLSNRQQRPSQRPLCRFLPDIPLAWGEEQ